MVPAAFRAAYDSARTRAGLIDRSDRARIVVSGRDRATYLQGLLTNDIPALGPGEGCYAAYLTPQGRMITDLWVYELGDVILLTLGASTRDVLLQKLDQFIFSEDVQLGDVSHTFLSVAAVGPAAARSLGAVLEDAPLEALEALGAHGNRRARFGGQPAIVLRVDDTGEPGYEVLCDASLAGDLRLALLKSGVEEIDQAVAEALRIEAGVPRFHRDMNEDTIPLEAGIEARAISLTKGCYVGQEVIIRVLHRGHGRVARKLAGLIFEGEEVPAAGSAVQADGREVGATTSTTMSPALDRPIALAYLHRDFLVPGTRISVNGVDGHVQSLPFVPRPAG